MTTVHTHAQGSTSSTSTWPVFAAVSSAIALILTAIGTFWSPLSSYETTGWDPLYLINVAMIAVGAAVVFGLVVRTATPANGDRRAVVLAGLGLASIVGFWTGLPAVLAGGAVCCSLLRGSLSTAGKVSVAIATVTLGLAIWLALAG